MTTLTRPVRREVQAHYHKPIIIELDPTRGAIGFREKGSRKTFYLPIMTAYAMAVRTEKKED